MARRKIDDPCVVPINFRVSEVMKSEVDASADAQRISTNDWIRKAIQEKLNREKDPPGDALSTEELEEVVTRIIEEKLAEKRREKELKK